ncbi:MAG: hypothetical protein HYX78_01315 [Armatimonadetes bacterium]|nr:hypothetical protein [Armatimonadota bacterium]
MAVTIITGVKLDEFKKVVTTEFGPRLKNATPANVREFLDRMQLEVLQNKKAERIVINESATSYEEVIKDFFTRILDAPKEDAVMALWMLALDLSFAAIEYQYEERFANLFREQDD